MRSSFPRTLTRALALSLALGGGMRPAAAEVALDGTLPNGRTDVLGGPVYDITEDLGYRPSLGGMGGAPGRNLFHSFFRFDVGFGETARFSAVHPTDNVIARVTSWDPLAGRYDPRGSQIDGRVEFDASLGDANLFLVNPAGVVFGPEAEVGIAGGTFVTSADYLRLDDAGGTTLDSRSTSVDWNDPVLASAEPAAFGFVGGADAADVRIDGDPFSFSLMQLAGDRFTAVGGNVRVSQAIDARGSQIALAAVGSAGVEVPVDVEAFDAVGGNPATLGTVSLLPTQTTVPLIETIDAGDPSAPQGTIVIRGGRFEIARNATPGNDGYLNAGGRLPGSGAAIDIEVAGDASIGDGARIEAIGVSSDTFGGVRIEAGGVVHLEGGSVASGAVGTGGDGGGVTITGSSVNLTDGARVFALSQSGRSGDIVLESGAAVGPNGEVVDAVRVEGSEVWTEAGASDPGASIEVDGAALVVEDLGSISTSSTTTAQAGSIGITAGHVVVKDSVQGGQQVSRSRISTLNQLTTAGDPAQDAGGRITIDGAGGEVIVTDGGAINTQTQGTRAGGDITIDTGLVRVTDGGVIETGTTAAGTGGAISITAQSVEVLGGGAGEAPGFVVSAVAPGATGAGGDIGITTHDLVLRDGGQIATTTEGDAGAPATGGQGGDIVVRATGAVVASGSDPDANPSSPRPSGFFARSGFEQDPGITADGGSIDVEAASIEILDGAEVSTRTLTSGNAGNILLDADGTLRIAGTGQQSSVVSARGLDGAGGDITLRAQQVLLLDGGSAGVSSNGAGDSGLLTVDAGTLVVSGTDRAGVNRSGLAAETFGAGEAGGIDITLRGGDVVVEDGGSITARSKGDGGAGSIVIRGADRVEVGAEGTITAESEGFGATQSGEPGSVTIDDTRSVSVARGGAISARALGPGDGGSVTVTARDSVQLNGGVVTAEAETGQGGDVTLEGGRLVALTDGAEVSTRAAGAKPAGDITIRSDGLVMLAGGSRVTAEATGSGDAGSISVDAGLFLDATQSAISTQAAQGLGGNIEIAAAERVYLVASEITTSVKTGEGSGGNITIDPEFVVLNQSRILAQADEGAGGNIVIRTGNLIRSADSVIDASSRLGVDGNVVVSTPEAELSGQVAALPENLLDATAMLREACAARDAPVGSFSVQTVRPQPPPDAPLSPETGRAAGETGVCEEP